MSLAKKCDRCGNPFTFYPYSKENHRTTANSVIITQVGLYPGDEESSLMHIDLCPECMKNFISWVTFYADNDQNKREKLDELARDGYKIIQNGYKKYFENEPYPETDGFVLKKCC